MNAETISKLIEYLLSFALVFSILILGARTLKHKVILFVVQSLALISVLLLLGILHNSQQVLWVAALTFAGKCIGIPWVLFWVLRKVKMKKSVESYLTLPTTMLIGGGLILLAHFLSAQLFTEQSPLFREVFSVGISLVFIGFMIMMTFKKAFMQVLGLYVLDNGIYCMTLATVFEMPIIIEMGILFELLLGVLVMGLFVRRIKQYFDTVNVDYLQELHD